MRGLDRVRRMGLWLLRHVPMPAVFSSSLQGRVLPGSDDEVAYTNGDGIRFELNLHEYIQKRIYVYQYYEPECVRAARSFMSTGGTMVDVGANIGQYSLLASRLVGAGGRVLAFEPSPAILERLYRHLSLNRADNVEVIPCAVSDKAGSEPFYASAQAGNQGQGSLISPDPVKGQVRVSTPQMVRTVRLDAELQARGIGDIDFMKVDVEGHEMAVLRSAEPWLRQHRIRALMVELSPENLRQAGCEPADIVDYLQGFGLRPLVAGWFGRLRPLRMPVTTDTNAFFVPDGGWA